MASRLLCRLRASVLLFPFAPAWDAQAPFAEEPSRKTELREAVFRYLFVHTDLRSKDSILCIQPETPQPERFLFRFSDVKATVVWASQCKASGPMGGMDDTKTGQRALRFSIRDLRWTGGNATVDVETYSDEIGAHWNLLTLVIVKGQWVVSHDEPNGIS